MTYKRQSITVHLHLHLSLSLFLIIPLPSLLLHLPFLFPLPSTPSPSPTLSPTVLFILYPSSLNPCLVLSRYTFPSLPLLPCSTLPCLILSLYIQILPTFTLYYCRRIFFRIQLLRLRKLTV